MAQQTRSFDNPLFREIHKNTWLKKVNLNDPRKVVEYYYLRDICLLCFAEERKIMGSFLCT